ncbi:hypothetical protein ACLI4R_14470 [Natrialbaceae archaeon A-chndr2]
MTDVRSFSRDLEFELYSAGEISMKDTATVAVEYHGGDCYSFVFNSKRIDYTYPNRSSEGYYLTLTLDTLEFAQELQNLLNRCLDPPSRPDIHVEFDDIGGQFLGPETNEEVDSVLVKIDKDRLYLIAFQDHREVGNVMVPVHKHSDDNSDPKGNNLRDIHKLLEDSIDDFKEATTSGSDTINIVEGILHRFGSIASAAQDRYNDRPGIAIEDEYDVQYLLETVLRGYFDDVRAEEYTPTHAGASSRIDFLLKKEGIGIEVKKTRPGLKEKALGDQLSIDKERYAAHPDCETLICFIYDPDSYLSNPAELMDLNQNDPFTRVKISN